MGICSSQGHKNKSRKAGSKKLDKHPEKEQLDHNMFKKTFTTDYKVGKKLGNTYQLYFRKFSCSYLCHWDFNLKNQDILIRLIWNGIRCSTIANSKSLSIGKIYFLFKRHPNLVQIFETHKLFNGYYIIYE